MTELERRRVTIHQDKHHGGLGYKIVTGPMVDGSIVFELRDKNDDLVATSFSDHSLSKWGIYRGMLEISHRYHLGLGDDAR